MFKDDNEEEDETSGNEVDDDDAGAIINGNPASNTKERESLKNTTAPAKKPTSLNGNIKKRPTAADFMSDSEEYDVSDNEEEFNIEDQMDSDPEEEAAEDSVDVDEQDLESADSDNSEGADEEEDEDEEDEGEDDADSFGSAEDEEKSRRAELRQIMSEEQKAVVATISQAARADAEKGNAVKQQRKTFDALLNVRIRLQKALVATNSMAPSETEDITDEVEGKYRAAEEAALKLWNTLNGIRSELSKLRGTVQTGQKRKFNADTSTTITEVWKNMQDMEVSSIHTRQSTLEKWSAKAKGTTALPISRKLNPAAAFQQSITAVLQEQLANPEHLVKKTRIPRSCAPVQAKLKLTEDASIYDDADFYQLLLKELIDQRMVDSAGSVGVGDNGKPMQWAAVKEAKTKKVVDTKASKGRKLRYTVHEKLQNFMAPENRGSWEQDAIDRFFGTLLGQKMTLGEDDEEISEEENDLPLEEEGLMLFRS